MAVLEELIGQVLDEKYRIEKQLGQGGMGAVYLATHIGTKRLVALKVIAPQFMAHPESVERFKREAEAAGRLRHPNVVNVTDFGFADVGKEQVAYLVMEYLNGCSLGDMMKKRGRLTISFAIDIVEQVCLAIDKAHQEGIIHRDLKPDNIWLEPNGRGGYNVKVLDFGLAKLRYVPDFSSNPAATIHSAPQQPLSESSPVSLSVATMVQLPDVDLDAPTHVQLSRDFKEEKTQVAGQVPTLSDKKPQVTVEGGLTQVGAVLGTPLYMSPEQCRGENLDARSDIYSLGVIVYQMLAGKTPFTGEIYSLITKHTQVPPPMLKDQCSDIPTSVAEVVMSALAKNPEERPATAGAFATSLSANAEGETPILDQANELYQKSSSLFLRVSILTYAPFILLINLLMLSSKRILPLFLPVILFASTLNTAGAAIIVRQMRLSPLNPVGLRSICATLIKHLPGLIGIAIRSGLAILLGMLKLIIPGLRVYRNHSLYAPVVIMEGKQGGEALSRSKSLAERLRYPLVSIQLHEFLISLVIMVLCLLINNLKFGLDIDKFQSFLPQMKPLTLVVCFVILLMISSAHCRYAIAFSLLYFKARLAGGETLNEPLDQELGLEDLPGRPKVSLKRTAGLLASLLLKQTAKVLISFLIVVVLFFAVFVALMAREAKTNLSVTVMSGNNKAVKELLDKGADVNSKGFMGMTPLMAAAQTGRTEIIKMLIERRADVNIKGIEGTTALMLSTRSGFSEIVSMLLEHGADVNAVDDSGENALMIAAKMGHIKIVQALVAAGANINARDKKGKSALDYAKEEKQPEIEELFNNTAAAH